MWSMGGGYRLQRRAEKGPPPTLSMHMDKTAVSCGTSTAATSSTSSTSSVWVSDGSPVSTGNSSKPRVGIATIGPDHALCDGIMLAEDGHPLHTSLLDDEEEEAEEKEVEEEEKKTRTMWSM
eukprot:CAMPEP_0194322814 /NCGR_PEP_ID=MMETSP0171-20130528/22301_1 /TAXON_ID=218684 /ORGANISM="Corethron pennatum, Strain L29A3" /LENGTH=121 /DNA_ID=CAMNT_0039081199 /DNA_START=1 /DNA_END=363 /DNA_ORIENTATION=-